MITLADNFKANLAQLPAIDAIARIELTDAAGAVVAQIENADGKRGSLAVYNYLNATYGTLNAEAAAQGLAIFAEIVEDAKNRPGAHPNIDRLIAIAAGADPLTITSVAA